MAVDLYMRLASQLLQTNYRDRIAELGHERTESTFKKVYRFFKFLLDENLIKTYDEAYLCRTLANYLNACSVNKVKDPKLNKFVRLVVIFLLKLKSFHQD